MPDVSKWIKSPFSPTNSWMFASDVKESQFSHSYCRLTFMPRLHLNFQNHNFTPVFDGWPSFRAKGLRRVPPFAFYHVFGCPTCDLCRGLPVPERNSHCTTCLRIRNARSPQTVAAGKEVSHFTTPNVCPSDTHDLRRGLPKDKQDPHFATRFWVSDTPQRVTFRKPMPGCPCRQREIEELEKSDFAGVQIQFDHLEVSWNPV